MVLIGAIVALLGVMVPATASESALVGPRGIVGDVHLGASGVYYGTNGVAAPSKVSAATLSTVTVGISDEGTVTGFSIDDGAFRPVVWSRGKASTLDGAGAALNVNESGTVVGGPILFITEDGFFPAPGDAFVWRDGKMTKLDVPPGHRGRATSINERGQIAGTVWAENAEGQITTARAVVWQNGRMITLPGFGGQVSFGSGINDRGDVVGSSQTASGVEHAVLWINGGVTDLGTFGGKTMNANAINNSRLVSGTSQLASGDLIAFSWSRGRIAKLAGLPSSTGSVSSGNNEHAQIVGTNLGSAADRSDDRAVVWQRDGTPMDLGSFRWHPTGGQEINNLGQVAGFWNDESGTHAALWSNGRWSELPDPQK